MGARLEKPASDHQADAPGATGDQTAFTAQVEKFCMRGELAGYHVPPFSCRTRPKLGGIPDAEEIPVVRVLAEPPWSGFLAASYNPDGTTLPLTVTSTWPVFVL